MILGCHLISQNHVIKISYHHAMFGVVVVSLVVDI